MAKKPAGKKTKSLEKTSFVSKLRANPMAFVFVFVFAIAGTIFLYQSYAAPPSKTVSGTKIYFSPSSGTARIGSNYTVEVREDSLSTTINAVNAEISYDPSKFSVAGIDASGSAFEFKFIEDNANGLIRIARGTTNPKSGDQLVAKVTLTPVSKTRKTTLTFNAETALASADTSTNTLQNKLNGSYTIK